MGTYKSGEKMESLVGCLYTQWLCTDYVVMFVLKWNHLPTSQALPVKLMIWLPQQQTTPTTTQQQLLHYTHQWHLASTTISTIATGCHHLQRSSTTHYHNSTPGHDNNNVPMPHQWVNKEEQGSWGPCNMTTTMQCRLPVLCQLRWVSTMPSPHASC